VTLKHAVRRWRSDAAGCDLHAKPIFGAAGSGMHTHQVLTEAGKDTKRSTSRRSVPALDGRSTSSPVSWPMPARSARWWRHS